jgi:hypothetical protein
MLTPEEGYCFVYGAEKYDGDKPRRVFRQTCAGRKCKYYFATEKRCVKANSSRIKIVDCDTNLLDGVCFLCGKTRHVFAVWCSKAALYKRVRVVHV